MLEHPLPTFIPSNKKAMKNKNLLLIWGLCLTTLMSCSQNNVTDENVTQKTAIKESKTKKETHQFGGWYCPDNLIGFPAVNIANWKNVPVVNGRMATQEETQNGTSLFYVDPEKYPEAKPLDITMPKLARFYNYNTKKEEIIIVIQAITVSDDSLVGFRYLNGGNGSARLNEVTFLNDDEIKNISPSNFVTQNIEIEATQKEIWEVITSPAYFKILQPIFDKEKILNADWVKSSKVNFNYLFGGAITSEYAGNLYGNQYIQVDYSLDNNPYVEKFLLLEDKQTQNSTLQIVCGPYGDDFETQKNIINTWANKVKELSEFQNKIKPNYGLGSDKK